jgi:hypothetical protein
VGTSTHREANLRSLLDAQRLAFDSEPPPTVVVRRSRIDRLIASRRARRSS